MPCFSVRFCCAQQSPIWAVTPPTSQHRRAARRFQANCDIQTPTPLKKHKSCGQTGSSGPQLPVAGAFKSLHAAVFSTAGVPSHRRRYGQFRSPTSCSTQHRILRRTKFSLLHAIHTSRFASTRHLVLLQRHGAVHGGDDDVPPGVTAATRRRDNSCPTPLREVKCSSPAPAPQNDAPAQRRPQTP